MMQGRTSRTRMRLAAGLSLDAQYQLASTLEDEGDSSRQKILQGLQKKASQSRQNTDIVAQKLEWRQEYERLAKHARNLQKEVDSIMDTWKMKADNDPLVQDQSVVECEQESAFSHSTDSQTSQHTDTSNTLHNKQTETLNSVDSKHHSIMQDPFKVITTTAEAYAVIQQMSRARQTLRSRYRQQYTELKNMYTQVFESESYHHDGSHEQSQIIHAIRNVIAECQADLTKEWQVLQTSETECVKHLIDIRRQLIQWQRSYTEDNNCATSFRQVDTETKLHDRLAEAGANDCPDVSLVMEATERLLAMRQLCIRDLEEMKKEFMNQWENTTTSDDQSLFGGWSLNDHEFYIAARDHARATFRTRMRKGQSLHLIRNSAMHQRKDKQKNTDNKSIHSLRPEKALLYTQVSQQLKISMDKVKQHDEWFEARLRYKESIRERIAKWTRERDSFLSSAKHSFTNALEKAQETELHEKQAIERFEADQARHSTLRAMKQAKLLEEQKQIYSETLQHAKQEEEQLRYNEQRKREIEATHTRVKMYRQEQEALEEEQQRQREVAELAMKMSRLEQIAANKGNVEARQAAIDARREEKQLQKEAQEEAERQRQARLEQLTTTVPYYEAVQSIPVDRERVQSHTTVSYVASELGAAHAAYIQHRQAQNHPSGLTETALANHTKFQQKKKDETDNGSLAQWDSSMTVSAARRGKMDKALAAYRNREAGGALYTKHGFEDTKVQSDMRTKLSNALQQAGLLHSEYARNILSNYVRPTPKALQPSHNWTGGD